MELLRSPVPALQETLYALEAQAHALAGHDFLLTSPQQVSVVLYTELGLKAPSAPSSKKKTSTNTGEKALQELSRQHPLPAVILQHREIKKLRTTYIDPFCSLAADSQDGRLHSSFLQLATVTGRLASCNPNLQNLPRGPCVVSPVHAADGTEVREGFTINIRQAVRASEGCVFVASDFCQLEVRILAHFCRDPTLIGLLSSDGDTFRLLYSRWRNIPVAAVSDSDRARAKQCIYGVIYGMGPDELAQRLSIPRQQALGLMKDFRQRFPVIETWRQSTLRLSRQANACHTLFRRRRHLPNLHSTVGSDRAQAERMAVNGVIQGTASDIMKQAMVQADKGISQLLERLREAAPGGTCQCVLQVHDELVYEVSEGWAAAVARELSAAMEGCVPLEAPLRVSTTIGRSLGDLR